MEIIYIIISISSLLLCRLAYDLGKRTGKIRFINKINRLTVSKMLEHKRTCFKKL
jgi:hypothetical protein